MSKKRIHFPLVSTGKSTEALLGHRREQYAADAAESLAERVAAAMYLCNPGLSNGIQRGVDAFERGLVNILVAWCHEFKVPLVGFRKQASEHQTIELDVSMGAEGGSWTLGPGNMPARDCTEHEWVWASLQHTILTLRTLAGLLNSNELSPWVITASQIVTRLGRSLDSQARGARE
ncbi:hypothetical protein Micbo1qcDRAFT_15345 [Microdochium bolleyi]|uniref:Uncharacterized protein n=1 Tax=Microdochium bolleyi TaxID=196109 RepID=A0A136II96_9PEZI|nr:hypothetical protein Micbo1qcDRAFT_15345 [Microdochium bolleyi]